MVQLIVITIAVVSAMLSAVAHGSDLAKEQRWREQIVEALFDGGPIDLEADGVTFLGIYTESAVEGSSKGVVVMHGTGVHPDWDTVVQPLRVGLAERGWHTLSIQMPVLPNAAEQAEYTALFAEVPGRIESAARYLRETAGATRVVLIGHSLGASMAAYSQARHRHSVIGIVAIGMGSGESLGHPDRNNMAHLASIRVPLLDLYGSQDLEDVVTSAPDRARVAAANVGYRQVRAQGADHFFDGEESALMDYVLGFIDGL